MDFPVPSQIEAVLLILVAIGWIFQLWFLLRRVRPFAFYNEPINQPSFGEPVSIIICAKNEAENLRNFLPSILEQEYPEFEVVVVNDASEDDSDMVLAQLKAQYPQLYYTTIPKDRKFSHGKKLALTLGVKAARFEYLLMTDADCQPAGKQWLSSMAQGFAGSGKEIVLGFGAYQKRKGFVNKLIRYDAFFTAIQYFGFALSGKPYMGVGRNLAYTKNLFTENNGLKRHAHILSGDDDLFIQQVASKKNCSVVTSHNSHTVSLPSCSFKDWKHQKSRHLTTSKLYKPAIKIELALEPLSRQIFLFSSVFLIFFNTFALITICLYLIRLLILLMYWARTAAILNQGRIYWAVMYMDWLHPWLLLMAKVGTLKRRNNKQWK